MSYKPESGRNSLISLGHCCIEYFAHVDYEFLKNLGLNKGVSNGDNKFGPVKEALRPEQITKDCGSSESNVACGYSSLGLPASFIGCIGNDYDGYFFKEDLPKYRVSPYISVSEGETGIIYTLITPDKDRTFAYRYGSHQSLNAKELPFGAISNSAFFHSCAYSLYKHSEALENAIKHSRHNNVKVSFDLSSPSAIKDYNGKIEEILSNADILFINEEESAALGFNGPFKLIEGLTKKYGTSLIAFKMGKDGSILSTGKKNEAIYIRAYRADEVNTSGAGDSYAAGLLYSIAKGYDLLTSGKIASYYASRAVMRLSSRPEKIGNIERLI